MWNEFIFWTCSASWLVNFSYDKRSEFQVRAIVNGLKSPTTMAFLDPTHILVLEKDQGTVRMIENHTLVTKPLLDLNVSNKFERGLLGIELSNKSKKDLSNVYLYYTKAAQGDGNDVCITTTKCDPKYEPVGNRLYKFDLAENKTKLLNSKLILSLPAAPGAVHNGGQITE